MALMPTFVFATSTIDSVLKKALELVNLAVPIVMSLAVVYFIYSLVMYMTKEGEDKAAAKTSMIWGIVILFVIVSMWGLVAVLSETFGVKQSDIPTAKWVTE